jgi:hypothetical protein
VSQPEQRRRRPSSEFMEVQLQAQRGRCFYCRREFGAMVWRGKRLRVLRLEWEHRVPYAFNQNNQPSNFVAACHVCNGLKSSHCFDSDEEARAYLDAAWKEKGYEDV